LNSTASSVDIHTRITLIRVIQGLESVSDAGIIPISGSEEYRGILIDVQKDAARDSSLVNRVGFGFSKTMGTPVLEGRELDEHDAPGSPLVAIVNQAFAEKYFGSTNPISKTFRLGAGKGKPQPAYQIVGIVANAKYVDLREKFQATAVAAGKPDGIGCVHWGAAASSRLLGAVVCLLQLFELTDLIHLQPHILFLPSMEGLFGDPHPPDQFNQWNPCFRLLQYRDDLLNVGSLLLHGKSPLPEALDFAGN
jgi:MacB-like protein